jgi:hypothetical protein
MRSRARGREGAQLVEDAAQLALGLDEPRDRRAAEVGEDGGVALAVAGAVEPAAPARGRLLEAPYGEAVVAAGGGDEALHADEPRHERVGEVARRDRLERRLAQLGLRLVEMARPGEGSARASRASGRLTGAPAASAAFNSSAARPKSPRASATMPRSCAAVASSSATPMRSGAAR